MYSKKLENISRYLKNKIIKSSKNNFIEIKDSMLSHFNLKIEGKNNHIICKSNIWFKYLVKAEMLNKCLRHQQEQYDKYRHSIFNIKIPFDNHTYMINKKRIYRKFSISIKRKS